jgi:hypothetical protein
VRKYGDPNTLKRPSKSPHKLCTIDGCKNLHKSKGFCNTHYSNYWHRGTPYPSAIKGTFQGRGKYTFVRVSKGKWRREHHIVMEGLIGRPLRPFENVHHKNTIRNDNSPTNLELWANPQPSGGRVSDLVAWVIENYRTELEVALKEREANENHQGRTRQPRSRRN